MTYYIKVYLTALAVFLGIDFVWLGVVAQDFYQGQIGFLMKDSFNLPAALVFYCLYVGGLVFFVLDKALALGSWQYALLVGMLFGFITYATYDLTNLATVKDWPLLVTVVDLVWGTFLGGLTAVISYFIVS